MSTKFTIWHDEDTHVFGDAFVEDVIGIEIINPITYDINFSLDHGSKLTLTLSKEHLANIAKAYIEWNNNTCKTE